MDFVVLAIVATVVAIIAAFLLMKPIPPPKVTKSTKAPQVLKIRDDLTVEEVAKHNTRDDCWIIIDNNVYNVTDYIDEHPGGDSIMNHAGGDSTEGAHGPQHPPSMWDVLKLFYIGELKN